MKKVLCLLLAILMLATALVGCGSRGKTLMKAGGTKISVNVYSLYLSRMKGSLELAGYEVEDPDFWNTVVSADGTRMGDFYTNQVFGGLKHVAAAMVMYEEYGLKLPKAVEDEIDSLIDQLIEEAGSKTKLNNELKKYGANVTTLRDSAILEAKLAQLKAYLYGDGGSLIADSAIEEYYQETYLCGYQIKFASYYYVYNKDSDGYAMRYTDDKYTTVAYLDETKLPEAERENYFWVDRTGEYATKYDDPAFGDKILLYKTELDGKELVVVAYDTEKGVIKYEETTDKDGNVVRKTKEYTIAEMELRRERAEQIAAECKGNQQLFLQRMNELSDNLDFHTKLAPDGMYFSVGSYATDSIFSVFSNALAKMEVGDTAVLEASDGYYILMSVPPKYNAWKDKNNSRWFGSLLAMTLEHLLQQETQKYIDDGKITWKDEVKDSVDLTGVSSIT